MGSKKVLVHVLVLAAGLFLLLSSNVWAEPCQADITCDEKVDLSDLVIMKGEFLSPDCGPCENCPYGMVDCGDRCIDPMTDEDYCGADFECAGGTPCGTGEICSLGVCILSCQPGQVNCNGNCVDTNTDEDYCGSCSNACDSGQVCDGGMCVLTCPPGMTKCGGLCVNTDTDEEYCGSCTNSCTAGEICDAGNCLLDCPPGQTNCGGTCFDTTTDEDHCGLCYDSCESGEMCIAGVCEPCSSSGYPAPVPKTWQTTSYATGDDGDLEKGVEWPNPRFTDNGDGTVTDNLTGLLWLKNANCFGQRLWINALSDSNGLEDGECGLTDGSVPGDWRLPNRFELESLLDMAYAYPAVSNTAGTGKWTAGNAFINVQSYYYWSSTTYADITALAWFVLMTDGDANDSNKGNAYYVWPVRGPQ